MHPVLFRIGPFTLYSLWLLVTIGILVGTMLFLKRAKYQRLDMLFILKHWPSMFLSSVLLSRIAFFITSWGYFGPLKWDVVLKQILFFWQPGYSFWGALLGFMGVLWIHCKRDGEDFAEWIGTLLVPVFVGILLGNIGQFMDGQAYGSETILPWGITFNNTNVKYTVPVHPTQIYSVILISTIFLSRKKLMEKWDEFSDQTTWVLTVITSYSLIRFGLEFLRGDDTLQVGAFRLAHFVLLITFVWSGILLYKRLRKTS